MFAIFRLSGSSSIEIPEDPFIFGLPSGLPDRPFVPTLMIEKLKDLIIGGHNPKPLAFWRPPAI
jgi:hypothetical protein